MGLANKPFSLADGDPDGLRVVARSNWIGKAPIFRRTLLPKVKQRDELGQTGVCLLPALGVQAFEQAAPATAIAAIQLTCNGKGVVASGYESSQGFVVKEGSHAVGDVAPSLKQYLRGSYGVAAGTDWQRSTDTRHDLFSQDIVFASPTATAMVVLGRSATGRIEWKDAKGVTLKLLQEGELGDAPT